MIAQTGTSYTSYQNSPYLSFKHSTYFSVYDQIFEPYRGKAITFVEVGVLNGGSLFMWREFFGPEARIIGIDLSPAAKKWESDGFEIFIGSQSDSKFWQNLKAEVGPVDILLDDGGHTYRQQIVTVECMLPAIRDGGLIAVEDTHTSYQRAFGAPTPYSFIGYAKNIVDGINYRFGQLRDNRRIETQIHSVSFYESFVVFHIDRQLCSVKSMPTVNRGATMNAPDARNDDEPSQTFREKLLRAFAFTKKVPLLSLLAEKTWQAITTRATRRDLGSYFRY